MCCLLLNWFAVNAQSKKADSLFRILPKEVSDTRFDMLGMLYCDLKLNDTRKAEEVMEIYAAEATMLKDSFKISNAYWMKGSLLYEAGKIDEAIDYYNKCVRLCERQGYNTMKIPMYNFLAMAYRDKGDFQKELEYNFKRLKIVHEEGDSSMVSISYNNVGLAYEDLHDFEMALKYYLKAYQTQMNNNLHRGTTVIISNISCIYSDLEKYDLALKYAKLAEEFCVTCSQQDEYYKNWPYGYTYFAMGNLDQAEIKLRKAADIARRAGIIELEIQSLKFLAEVKLKRGEKAESLILMDSAWNLVKDTDLKVLKVQLNKLYSIVFQSLGEYEKSLVYFNRYSKLNEEVYGGKMALNVSKTIASFYEQNNRSTIETQQDLLLLKQQSINQERIIVVFLVVLTVLLVLLIFLFWSNISERRKVNQLLDQKVRSRTHELEESYRRLEKMSIEQQENINSLGRKMQSGMATLKGIAEVAKLDTEDPKALGYISKIEREAEKLHDLSAKA